jgi:hypothetical protein
MIERLVIPPATDAPALRFVIPAKAGIHGFRLWQREARGLHAHVRALLKADAGDSRLRGNDGAERP